MMSKPQWWVAPLLVWIFSLAAILCSSLIAISWPLVIVAEWIVYIIPLFVIYWYIRSFEGRRRFWPSIGIKRENVGKGIVWALAIFVILVIILAVYNQAVIWLMGKNPVEEQTKHFEEIYPDWYFVYFLFASFVPVGFFEEGIYRGFVLGRLMVKGVPFAILVSSLLHSSLHLWYVGVLGVTGIPLYGSAFILFASFGFAYVKSGNILGLALLHGLNNAMLSVRHFFGSQLVGAIWLGVTSIGAVCLGYLGYKYLMERSERGGLTRRKGHLR